MPLNIVYVEHAEPPVWWACPSDGGPQGIGATREEAIANLIAARDRKPWQFYRWFFIDRAKNGNPRCVEYVIGPICGWLFFLLLLIVAPLMLLDREN